MNKYAVLDVRNQRQYQKRLKHQKIRDAWPYMKSLGNVMSSMIFWEIKITKINVRIRKLQQVSSSGKYGKRIVNTHISQKNIMPSYCANSAQVWGSLVISIYGLIQSMQSIEKVLHSHMLHPHQSPQQMASPSLISPIAVNTMSKSKLGRKGFSSSYTSMSHSITEGSQDKNSSKSRSRGHEGVLLAGSLTGTCVAGVLYGPDPPAY